MEISSYRNVPLYVFTVNLHDECAFNDIYISSVASRSHVNWSVIRAVSDTYEPFLYFRCFLITDKNVKKRRLGFIGLELRH